MAEHDPADEREAQREVDEHVVVVEELDQPVEPHRQVLDAVLAEDVERPLGIDDATRVGERGALVVAGQMADLLVFDRNPLDDLRNTSSLKFVMKNGRMYDASNLDEVYPRKVKGAPFPWNEDESPTRDKLMTP